MAKFRLKLTEVEVQTVPKGSGETHEGRKLVTRDRLRYHKGQPNFQAEMVSFTQRLMCIYVQCMYIYVHADTFGY